MLAAALAATPWGVHARAVRAEVDLRNGLPRFQIVGLPDTAVRESRERVQSAVLNSGFRLPARVVVVNLAPADLRKEGSHLDLGVALALLAAHGEIGEQALQGRLFAGELGLDGSIRSIRGALAIADLARDLRLQEVVLPVDNAPEAAALGTVPVVGVGSLSEAIGHLGGEAPVAPAEPESAGERPAPAVDLSRVRGQTAARRALEVTAAGGHNLLLVGPPGSGKTLLARCLAGILPELDRRESIVVTKIHSIASQGPRRGLIRRRPMRVPHASISVAGMVGGGPVPRPGEVTLAHAGVLFLDEFPEFRRTALEALRQPLEDGTITLSRARTSCRFPARFTLVAAMNPCRCGYLGDTRRACRCTDHDVERYRQRISGPILDRIDLHVEVPSVRLEEMRGPPGEASGAVAARVTEARDRQRRRLAGRLPVPVNAGMDDGELERWCALDSRGRRLLDRAFRDLGLSVRALTRVLKVARTIADLAGQESIAPSHVAEAIQYRVLDRLTRGP